MEHAAPAPEVVVTDRAMATRVTVRVAQHVRGDLAARDAAMAEALAVFRDVDRTCTRFDTSSDLMRVNREPYRWHCVPQRLLIAIEEARDAYVETQGRFDPRVLRDLVRLGYDRTLPFGEREVDLDGDAPRKRPALGRWRPQLRRETNEVLVGPDPVDLGGIGKGLAVRWASEALSEAAPSHLVEAGGDFFCAGRGPDGDAWRLGVEDPGDPGAHVAVLAVSDRAVTTSSARLRRWSRGGAALHHLIDPLSGMPGGEGLASVTVVGHDPARSEVWSKSLFIGGLERIGETCSRLRLAALWVGLDGSFDWSDELGRHLRWVKA